MSNLDLEFQTLDDPELHSSPNGASLTSPSPTFIMPSRPSLMASTQKALRIGSRAASSTLARASSLSVLDAITGLTLSGVDRTNQKQADIGHTASGFGDSHDPIDLTRPETNSLERLMRKYDPITIMADASGTGCETTEITCDWQAYKLDTSPFTYTPASEQFRYTPIAIPTDLLYARCACGEEAMVDTRDDKESTEYMSGRRFFFSKSINVAGDGKGKGDDRIFARMEHQYELDRVAPNPMLSELELELEAGRAKAEAECETTVAENSDQELREFIGTLDSIVSKRDLSRSEMEEKEKSRRDKENGRLSWLSDQGRKFCEASSYDSS
ncbi:uncharacterized protein I303_100415 [Kwoniella dejecticola CBS 10117]|uniref:Uncharacterized protein n=1 Tax=Kwoniella dejecticola CBS 10117 TaxID=1296121 RepID=A0A1A6AEZ5_9TREE|nr:uncharacterized protein I303_00415 [Kwoniella dejecticola CBS 10117]OBR88598.1 hypothetical protein I303_00415 [Kwoniella dejecticola CBS 10117]